MGSMHIGLEEAERGFERMAAFYAERARGGVDLIVTGGIAPNDRGRPRAGGATLTNEGESLTQNGPFSKAQLWRHQSSQQPGELQQRT